MQFLTRVDITNMLMKKPRHRIFDYTPRFYSSEKDAKERKKRKLGFTRRRKYNRTKRNPIILIVVLLIILYIYIKLSGSG
ncbi:hypothetical protein BMS3Abin03_00685 [bacterium BMS3Abin03]|nr:hypothetical protein BMS3Abin03_00685 [bacterium BMS3Abin03]